jgi:hypothetical protein
MKKETQNQSKCGKGPKMTNYEYDVFVSYRHLSEDSETHSIPLARSITQAFQLEGFKVFFYCNNTEDAFKVIQENKSRYYIILVTKDSIETINKYPYLTIEETESSLGDENGDGYNFAKEVYLIDKGIEAGEICKKNVLLLNVDKVFKKKRDIKTALLQHGFRFVGSQDYPWTEVIDFPTDERFSIYKMINPDSDKGGEVKIKKSPRYSYERVKRIMRWVLIPVLCVLFIAFVALLGAIVKQQDLSRIIEQYGKGCIVFAGGGTVQKYLANYKKIDVNNYKHYPSKYIHLPSAEAWSLLWDEITEDGNRRQYWPIVLSAEKLDDSLHVALLKSSTIVEYQVGEIPLMVQIKGDFKGKSICLEELRELLDDPSYAVHTTSDHSGTYNAYHQVLLNCNYDLDSLNSLKKKGRNVFTLSFYDTGAQGKSKHILLGNELYNYQNEKGIPSIPLTPVVYDAQTQDTVTIPLYVYTVAVKTVSGESNIRELCPQVKEFLYKIGCDTTQKITYTQGEMVKM